MVDLVNSMEPVLELTRDQIIAHIDRESRRRLDGLPAEEFLRAYQAGRLKDCGEFADLLALVQLLDPTDPLLAAA